MHGCENGARLVDGDSRMGPLVKTILVCVALETILAAACWLIVRSVAGAFLLSGLVFGPATIFVGPTLYAKFKERAL